MTPCPVCDHPDGGCLVFSYVDQPLPKERPRSGRGRTYTPKRTVEAEKRVLAAFRDQCPGTDPYDMPVRIDIVAGREDRVRADYDNLAKTVCDALNGHAYVDDYLIEDARVRVRRGRGRGNGLIAVHVGPDAGGLSALEAYLVGASR